MPKATPDVPAVRARLERAIAAQGYPGSSRPICWAADELSMYLPRPYKLVRVALDTVPATFRLETRPVCRVGDAIECLVHDSTRRENPWCIQSGIVVRVQDHGYLVNSGGMEAVLHFDRVVSVA